VKSINPIKSAIQTIYDIVTKVHGGELTVETIENDGLPESNRGGQAVTTFSIILPINTI
jgi:hypothetical protein